MESSARSPIATRAHGVAVLALFLAGCASQREVAATPPVCTLSPSELKSRREQLLPGLMARATEVTDLEDGLRLRFESHPGLLDELVRVVEQERTCCSFLRFALTTEPGNGPITFEVTGPPGTREMLRAL
jgi:hypothetical protein